MSRRFLIRVAVPCWAAVALSTGVPAMETVIAARDSMYACDNSDQMKAFFLAMFFGGKSSDLKCDTIPAGMRFLGDNVRRVNGFISGDGVANDFRGGLPFAFFGVAETEEPPAATPPAPAPPVAAQLPVPEWAKPAPAPAPAYVPPPPRTFKTISPSDVRATPSKWQGRDIEFRNVYVYWVDDDDIRLVTSDSLTVFAKRVRGGEQLKDKCETAKEALSSKCRAAVRFSYYSYDVDQPSGLAKRTVLMTLDAELIVNRKR
jgi:hypothetical protein